MSSPAIQSWQSAFDTRRDASVDARRAFAEFLARGLPTTKQDAWKYTDLRRLALKQFQVAAPTATPSGPIEALLLPIKDCHRIVFVDGALQPDLALELTQGIDIVAAIATLPRATDTTGSFELLNSALATHCVRIAIGSGAQLKRPVYIAWVWTDAARASMTHPRVVVTLSANTNATLIEQHIGAPDGANFANAVVEIQLGKHATLDHVRIQEDGATNFNIGSIHADVACAANYRNFQFIVGGSLSRTDISVRLSGVEAAAELYGLVFAQNSQHLDVRTCIEHLAPSTRSREDYRGIADQRGRVVFNGKVIVAKDAQKTDAAQSSRNLLLSPQAEIDTRPELEIYANDVKCAHGATVGQLDESALFYLRSRGLSHHQARGLLTHAFAAELVERTPVDAVRQYLLAKFMARMPTSGALR
jgi:Fe-S cluster assembly protein SufD